jgi:hypothetical protein
MSAALDAANRKPTFMFHGDAPILSGGNAYWPDRGPHGLHARLVNFPAAPGYGFSRDSMGRGRYNNAAAMGAGGVLPLTFFDHAPLSEHTWVFVVDWLTPPPDYNLLFNGISGAAPNARGIVLQFLGNAGTEQIEAYTQAIGSPWSYARNGTVGSGWKRGPHIGVVGVSPVARIWRDSVPLTATWTGAYVAPTYDMAVAPIILGNGAIQGLSGSCYHLSLWPWLFTKTDADTMTRLILDGGLG